MRADLLLDLERAGSVSVWAAFLGSALCIAWAGARLADLADRLADKTGLGEALVGAVLLGGCTSIAGSVTSITAAWGGHPSLAVSNAYGGIAAQTSFLALADLFHRKANLEHAAASVPNLIHGASLVLILGFLLMGTAAPNASLWGIHPVSFALPAVYLYGLRLANRARREPMWGPLRTGATERDEPDEERAVRDSLPRLWILFVSFAGVTAIAGYVVAESGVEISVRTGLSETVVGAMLTAIATSLPELITTIAAVRAGALTLAVGGIIGGNTFDTLFVAFSDVAYRDGPIFAAVGNRETFLLAVTLALTAVLLLGLIQREKHGVANIGFESVGVLLIYAASYVVLLFL